MPPPRRLEKRSQEGSEAEPTPFEIVRELTPEELDRLNDAVVARHGTQNFRLSMLGEVRPDYEDPRTFVRNNGNNVIQVQVEKRSGANSVAVSEHALLLVLAVSRQLVRQHKSVSAGQWRGNQTPRVHELRTSMMTASPNCL